MFVESDPICSRPAAFRDHFHLIWNQFKCIEIRPKWSNWIELNPKNASAQDLLSSMYVRNGTHWIELDCFSSFFFSSRKLNTSNGHTKDKQKLNYVRLIKTKMDALKWISSGGVWHGILIVCCLLSASISQRLKKLTRTNENVSYMCAAHTKNERNWNEQRIKSWWCFFLCLFIFSFFSSFGWLVLVGTEKCFIIGCAFLRCIVHFLFHC